MEYILSGIPGVQVYLDDVLVVAATREEHERRLSEVLKKLRDHNITLNQKKCQFGVT